jgi:PadR family transcriptional regulator, regulatory protein PadR
VDPWRLDGRTRQPRARLTQKPARDVSSIALSQFQQRGTSRRTASKLRDGGRRCPTSSAACWCWRLPVVWLYLDSLGIVYGVAGSPIHGHLDALVLRVLADRPAHGYAVIERLRRQTGGVIDLPEGTIYPALYRLEDEGLLTSRWTSGSGRRRREYTLSARGKRGLAVRQRQWRTFASAVERVLAGAS